MASLPITATNLHLILGNLSAISNLARRIFTQPPMPIKCAGAPQKALYLSGDHWRRSGVLENIAIDFYNAGAVLFGVAHFVPALMEYVEKYHAKLNFGHNLTKIDGPARRHGSPKPMQMAARRQSRPTST